MAKRSASEMGAGGPCKCHGTQMTWNARDDLVAGGYWRCRYRGSEAAKAWRERTRDQRRAYMRAWRDSHRQHRKDWIRKWRYGITPDQYRALFDEQRGLCAICGIGEGDATRQTLFVDHDHETGAIRGLLCGRCNWAIERLNHEGWEIRARAYLERAR